MSVILSFSFAFLLSGYLLITYSYKNAIEREIDVAIKQHQLDRFSVQATLITNQSYKEGTIVSDNFSIGNFTLDSSGMVAFFSLDYEMLFSNFPKRSDFPIMEQVKEGMVLYQFQNIESKTYILTCSKIVQNSTGIYLVEAADITELEKQQQLMKLRFFQIYIAALGIGVVLSLVLSIFITRPLKRLAAATDKLTEGNYSERLPESGQDETSELAHKFNQMADAINEKIEELAMNAKQKEDFAANFSHEIKTPLTSVIGYADMIYQGNLSGEEVRQAAWYIWNEGMRLESLSFKLMDLIVLNRQEFTLEEFPADKIIEDIVEGLKPIIIKENVFLCWEAEPAYILVDYDLLKTLLLNLVDNSVKADSSVIKVVGKYEESRYCISVCDNGRGIPEIEIERIREPFYMVDKSRSRKKHGAGLGLALVDKIVKIHGGILEFCSDGKNGTEVRFCLKCERVKSNE